MPAGSSIARRLARWSGLLLGIDLYAVTPWGFYLPDTWPDYVVVVLAAVLALVAFGLWAARRPWAGAGGPAGPDGRMLAARSALGVALAVVAGIVTELARTRSAGTWWQGSVGSLQGFVTVGLAGMVLLLLVGLAVLVVAAGRGPVTPPAAGWIALPAPMWGLGLWVGPPTLRVADGGLWLRIPALFDRGRTWLIPLDDVAVLTPPTPEPAVDDEDWDDDDSWDDDWARRRDSASWGIAHDAEGDPWTDDGDDDTGVRRHSDDPQDSGGDWDDWDEADDDGDDDADDDAADDADASPPMSDEDLRALAASAASWPASSPRAPRPDWVPAQPLRVPTLPMALSLMPANLWLHFRRPQRIPALRRVLGPSVPELARAATRSPGGVALDGVGLRVSDPVAAYATLTTAGATAITDVDAFVREHRMVLTDPAVLERHRATEHAETLWVVGSGLVFLVGMAGWTITRASAWIALALAAGITGRVAAWLLRRRADPPR